MKIKELWFNDFKDKNEWDKPLKEEDFKYYTDMYEAWQTKQKYKIWREVDDEWLTTKVKTWYFTITGNWDKVITWVWFKPKLVMFQIATSVLWSWVGQMTSEDQTAMNYVTWSRYDTLCLIFWDPIVLSAIYKSIDNDGFTITVSNFAYTSYVNYTAIR